MNTQRVNGCLAVLLLAPSVALAGGCPTDFTCPDVNGHVTVDGRYDVTGAFGVLETDDVQCAFDCLDGDRDAEHDKRPDGPRWVVEEKQDVGFMLDFVPGLRYEIGCGVRLPLSAQNGLYVKGNGALLRAVAPPAGCDTTRGIFQRILPGPADPNRLPNREDWDWTGGHAMNWRFDDLRFDGTGIATGQRPYLKGIVNHGTWGWTIRNCSFTGLDVGIDMRFAHALRLDNNTFHKNLRVDVVAGNEGEGYTDAGESAAVPVNGPEIAGYLGIGGGNGATYSAGVWLRGNVHVARSDARSAILPWNAPSTVVDGDRFDGDRGGAVVERRNWSNGAIFTVRDSVVAQEGSDTRPVFRLSSAPGGVTQLDNIDLAASDVDPELLVDGSAVTLGYRMAFRNFPAFRNATFLKDSTSTVTSFFSFTNVEDAPLPIDPSRWVGPRGVPQTVTLDGATAWRPPRYLAETDPLCDLAGSLRRGPTEDAPFVGTVDTDDLHSFTFIP